MSCFSIHIIRLCLMLFRNRCMCCDCYLCTFFSMISKIRRMRVLVRVSGRSFLRLCVQSGLPFIIIMISLFG